MKKTNEFKNKMGLLVLANLLFVGLACTINTGAGSSDSSKKNPDSGTSESAFKGKKLQVNKEAIGLKKEKREDAQSEETDDGNFVAVYSTIENPNYVQFDERLKNERMLEGIADALNDALALPEDISLTFDDCGQANAFYNPNNKSITVCYEMMELSYKLFLKSGKSEEEATQFMFGSTMFLFFHELGHALIDVLDLPATGREEDSVDQLSTYILLDEMTEEGQMSAVGGVLLFKMLGENQQMDADTFADEHSLNAVRFYNIACWMYGRDSETFAGLVQNGILPQKRAVRCANEYQDLSRAWERLVKPWVKE